MMSELLVFALKFAFLALLWVFILFTGAVIRSDLFGRRVPATKGEVPEKKPRASARTRRRVQEASAAIPTTLRITRGKQAGLTMALGDQLKIGRSADCQLILDDDYVSTQHARIYRSGTGYIVDDLGSTNGTLVNGREVATQPLSEGDRITIGMTNFMFTQA